MTARRLGVLWALTALVSLVLPATAQAWWERLEKLSGPGPFSGPTYEFRVACFGEVTPAASATRVGRGIDNRGAGPTRVGAVEAEPDRLAGGGDSVGGRARRAGHTEAAGDNRGRNERGRGDREGSQGRRDP